MSKKLKNTLLKYGITILIGAVMVWLVIRGYGYAEATTAAQRYRILSDAFTIPGVIFMLCALLVLVSNKGAFEGISYIFGYAFQTFVPGAGKKHEKYGDYVERKRQKGGVKGFGFLFFTGLAFLLVSIVFIVLFYAQ